MLRPKRKPWGIYSGMQPRASAGRSMGLVVGLTGWACYRAGSAGYSRTLGVLAENGETAVRVCVWSEFPLFLVRDSSLCSTRPRTSKSSHWCGNP